MSEFESDTDAISSGKNVKPENNVNVINAKSLGKQISSVRKTLELSQATFAETIGITPQTLSLIECGNFSTNNTLAKIYFSFLAILSDADTLNLLEDYQKISIEGLVESLLVAVKGLNNGLNLIIKKED